MKDRHKSIPPFHYSSNLVFQLFTFENFGDFSK